MRRCVLTLLICLFAPTAQAWNAAGHRLVAEIAWRQMSTATQAQISNVLRQHPDYPRWIEKARSTAPAALFAEASTWPDSIRNDPRYDDEPSATPSPAIAGLFDQARHKNWHYVDLNTQGKAVAGELDRQIERLSHVLRSTRDAAEMSYALPWLLHLLGDIHQPLHVGHAEDEGGNQFAIENPFKPRQPFGNLHSFWDDLPGPSGLRGQRLAKRASELLASQPAPRQGNVALWRQESRQLLAEAYPPTAGSLLPIITEEFLQHAQAIADRRIVAAGYRLGHLLESLFRSGVSRETP